jgi:hypothetical protein
MPWQESDMTYEPMGIRQSFIDLADVIARLRLRYGAGIALTFGRYQVGPPGDQENRRRMTFEAVAESVTSDWIELQRQTLAWDEELALHSLVRLRGRPAHIFMIDYEPGVSLPLIRALGLVALQEAIEITPIETPLQPTLLSFESGRSFHQYADVLISDEAWHHHLGSLLLMNPPADRPVVDARWIGHAIRKGYCALRWTRNTDRYRLAPRCIERATLPELERRPVDLPSAV